MDDFWCGHGLRWDPRRGPCSRPGTVGGGSEVRQDHELLAVLDLDQAMPAILEGMAYANF